jgi:hypothetical protein
VDRFSGIPGDYGAVRTPYVAGGGVDKHGVLRLHFVIGFANDKGPLRMTGLKRVLISQRADGSVKGKARCAISVVPTPSTPLRAGSFAKNAQEWGTHGAGCAGG